MLSGVTSRVPESTVRVVVVDDDDVTRRGLVELLGDQPEIEITGVLNHIEAVRWTDEWARVDVAMVDACDERRTDDQFPGVAVVEQIRRYRRSQETLVIVRTGQFFDDAVRRRMGEARADYFFHRSELQDAEDLRAVVLHPDRFRPGVPELNDPAAVLRYGVSRATRVNEAVARALQGGLGHPAPIRSARSRALIRQRTEFNKTARLVPINADGTEPDRNQRDPSMPQITRFLDWATRAKTFGS